jgi:hypothetical protein
MSFTAKRFLVILDLPGVLLHLNNPRLPQDILTSHVKVNYQ